MNPGKLPNRTVGLREEKIDGLRLFGKCKFPDCVGWFVLFFLINQQRWLNFFVQKVLIFYSFVWNFLFKIFVPPNLPWYDWNFFPSCFFLFSKKNANFLHWTESFLQPPQKGIVLHQGYFFRVNEWECDVRERKRKEWKKGEYKVKDIVNYHLLCCALLHFIYWCV